MSGLFCTRGIFIIVSIALIQQLSAFFRFPIKLPFHFIHGTALNVYTRPNFDGNVPRKMKRIMRSVKNATDFSNRLYTSRFEKYLTQESTYTMYSNLISTLNKTAHRVGVSLRSDFAVRKKDEKPDLLQALVQTDSLKIFSQIVSSLNIENLLSICHNVTLFAPDDSAFESYSNQPNIPEFFIQSADSNSTVFNHIIQGQHKTTKLKAKSSDKLFSLNGNSFMVRVSKTDSSIQFGGHKLLKSDIKCKNGIIHIISGLVTS